jgi:hypothetical protein
MNEQRLRVLILDDDRERHDWFDRHYAGHAVWHVYTVEQMRSTMKREIRFDVAQLDHDLGESENGLRAAEFIARTLEERKRPLNCVIHSWNPTGAQRMLGELLSAGLLATYRPFASRT